VAVPPTVRALRGATTVDADVPEQIVGRVVELVAAMLERNGLTEEELISILFTATKDIASMFPATAARDLGLADVPLIGAQELDVIGALPRCVRVMAHVNTERSRQEIQHVYLHGARVLREDLSE
jgi:chorismate mutase